MDLSGGLKFVFKALSFLERLNLNPRLLYLSLLLSLVDVCNINLHVYKKKTGRGEAKIRRKIQTLVLGAKQCNLLVKRYLQAFNGQSIINVKFLL